MPPTSGPAPLPPEPPAEHLKRKIAAILAADVAGYSRLVAVDEEGTLRDLAAARAIFDARVRRGGGRVFNTAGDSVMCEFDSAVEAVRAAIDIQADLAAGHAGVEPARRLAFRIGITIGDVVERGSDLLGDGVNIAARLEALAPPGGICLSRSAHEAVANKVAVAFRELGARRVKNLPQPLHAYLIAPPAIGSARGEAGAAEGGIDNLQRRPFMRKGRRRLLMAAAIAGFVGLGLPALRYARDSRDAADRSSASLAEQRPAEAPPPSRAGGDRTGDQRPPGETGRRSGERPRPAESGRPSPPAPPASPARAAEPRMSPAEAGIVFAALSREGVIADATTLPDLYHNARVLEAKGDRPAALAAYAAAAPLAGEAIDVHVRYASLLRAVNGAAAARQAYAALNRAAPSRAGSLTAAMQGETAERQARLGALVTREPDYLPAAFLLSEALLEARGGAGPTLTDQRLAFDNLERFLDGSASGSLASLFIDRSFLDGWLDTARRRRGEIEAAFVGEAMRPRATFARSGSGWTARLTLPEPATAILWRLGEQGEFRPTRASPANDAGTGQPLPSTEIELPSGTGRTTLYVTYRDRSGRDAGPFPLSFDPGSATIEASRQALERFPDSWVSFRSDLPELLSYAGLVSNRCAIAKATIGFGDGPPGQALTLPPCDPAGPSALPSGAGTLVTLPDGVDAVRIQLTYADGSESPVQTFRRP